MVASSADDGRGFAAFINARRRSVRVTIHNLLSIHYRHALNTILFHDRHDLIEELRPRLFLQRNERLSPVKQLTPGGSAAPDHFRLVKGEIA